MKDRIEYIDLAKCLGLLLVIYGHAGGVIGHKMPGMNVIGTFHVPLFFILSGLFHNDGYSIFKFIKRRFKTIFVPFLIFYSTLSYIFPGILHFIGSNTFANWKYSDFWTLCWNEQMYEGSLWFLISLFISSMAYRIVCSIVSNQYLRLIISLAVGFIGWCLGVSDTKMPLFLDSSFMAMMFYGIGHFFSKKIGLQYIPDNKGVLLFGCMLFAVIVSMFSGKMEYYMNTYEEPFLSIVICSILGTLIVVFVAKIIGYVPLLNYLGSHSLLLLCSHMTVMRFYRMFFTTNTYITALWLFFFTSMSYTLITPFVVRYLPLIIGKSKKHEN